MTAKFELGQTVVTCGVDGYMEDDPDFSRFIAKSIGRHINGDWGDLGTEDKATNDQALKEGYRILSAYQYNDSVKIWIITEWDRSVTTVLFPSEY